MRISFVVVVVHDAEDFTCTACRVPFFIRLGVPDFNVAVDCLVSLQHFNEFGNEHDNLQMKKARGLKPRGRVKKGLVSQRTGLAAIPSPDLWEVCKFSKQTPARLRTKRGCCDTRLKPPPGMTSNQQVDKTRGGLNLGSPERAKRLSYRRVRK